jgi:L-threonylcarbamoyladenylate synthase
VKTLSVDAEDPAGPVLEQALEVLKSRGLLIYPTDTFYALGGLASDSSVAVRVREAKGRPEGKALPLIAGDLEQARSLAEIWPPAAETLARRFWPGPLSLVVEARRGLPEPLLGGAGSLAVRVPGRGLPRRLALAAGPLISTSANRSGEPAPVTCSAALASVGSRVDLALDGGPGQNLPSTIVDLTGPQPLLLREGLLPWDHVLRALG